MKITEETKIPSLLKREGLKRVLLRHNIPCVGCPLANFEDNLTIKDVCKMYNIDKGKLLKDLNSYEGKNKTNEKG